MRLNKIIVSILLGFICSFSLIVDVYADGYYFNVGSDGEYLEQLWAICGKSSGNKCLIYDNVDNKWFELTPDYRGVTSADGYEHFCITKNGKDCVSDISEIIGYIQKTSHECGPDKDKVCLDYVNSLCGDGKDVINFCDDLNSNKDIASMDVDGFKCETTLYGYSYPSKDSGKAVFKPLDHQLIITLFTGNNGGGNVRFDSPYNDINKYEATFPLYVNDKVRVNNRYLLTGEDEKYLVGKLNGNQGHNCVNLGAFCLNTKKSSNSKIIWEYVKDPDDCDDSSPMFELGRVSATFNFDSDFKLNDNIKIEPNTLKLCQNGKLFDSKEITAFVKFVFGILRYSVPLILIGLGAVDFGRAIFSGNEEGVKKAQSKFIMRLIIAVGVFLVPSVLKLLLSIASGIWSNIDADMCGLF